MDFKMINDKLEINEDELPDIEIYKKLFDIGVDCIECGDKLSYEEIVIHRLVGITKPEDMSCQGCWMSQAYNIDLY
jgi:hypothetical protein